MPELYLKIVINEVLLRMASRDSRLNAGGLTTDEHNIKIGCKRDERYFTGTYNAGKPIYSNRLLPTISYYASYSYTHIPYS